jgi:mono/diheme cytochrome c family protein
MKPNLLYQETMTKRLAILAATALILGFTIASVTRAQSGARRMTIWDGVYSEAQAEAGQALIGQCRGCHGGNMDGGQAPALRGEKWMDYWREDTLDSMYTLIQTSMPPRASGELTPSQALSLVAYILQQNQLPAGNDALSIDALPAIHIEGKDGPQPLPNYAVVQLVGCTAKGDGDNWNLIRTTPPVRSRNPGLASNIELKAAAAKALGIGEFRLQNLAMAGITSSSLQEGRKMLAKGVLIRQAEGDRLSINSLQEIASTCGQ